MTMVFQYTDPTTTLVVTSTNRTPATGAEAVYHLIQTMVASGQWAHFASSDGITVSTPAGGSNTPSTPMKITNFNPTAATVGSMNNANAWVMLKQTGTGRLFGIQHSSTQSTNTTWKIKYVPQTAAFAAPLVNVAGTITQMCLFTDASDTGSRYLRGALAAFNAQMPTDNTYRFHCGCDNADGSFYAISWVTGTASVTGQGAIVFDKLISGTFPGAADDPNDDNDPYVWYIPGTGDNAWVFSTIGTGSETTGTAANSPCPMAFLRKDLLGEAFTAVTMAWIAAGASIVALPGSLGSNPHNGKDDNLPVFYLRRPALTSPVGWKGASSLIKMSAATRATGEPLTLSTTRDRVCIGPYNLPWDGSTPII